MKWLLTEPKRGDMLRIKIGNLYHYGIYVSDEEVIQFGLAPQARTHIRDCDVEVCVSDIDGFLCGCFLEVASPERKEAKKRRKPDVVVQAAQARIREKGYHILHNNCEHFAYECYLGEKYSSQTDGLRNMFRALPIVDVYLAEIPQNGKPAKVYPPERQREIAACGNEQVQREKYYAWKLLEYSLERTFGKKLKDVRFEKSASGKWKCDACEFSISHSKNAVCVTVSRAPVGVDVELIQPIKNEGILEKIFLETELESYHGMPELEKSAFFTAAWARKESLFKQLDAPAFFGVNVKELQGKTWEKTVTISGEEYALCVATETPQIVRFHENVAL